MLKTRTIPHSHTNISNIYTQTSLTTEHLLSKPNPSMDHLPHTLLLEILTRLHDSAHLTRSKLTCKTLNSLSTQTPSIHLLCSHSRYLKSRSPQTMSQITPFKTIFRKLIETNDVRIESVCIGVDNELRKLDYDDVEDDSDDLFLTESWFVEDWIRRIGEGLKVISVSDFWVQSCWRRSFFLAIVSSYCECTFCLY